ncbi:MAG: GxxExxY protein [Flavobacteriales bacterium]
MKKDDPQTFEIIGAAMEVHNTLGHGFLESIYHDAFCHELELRGIPFKRELNYPVFYKQKRLSSTYRADLVCFGEIIVELKAIKSLTSADEAQLLNYLKASGLQRGVILNFGSPTLQYNRRVWNFTD